MIAAGIFTESMALDITVLTTLLGMFIAVVGMFFSIKQSQREAVQSQQEAKNTRAKEMEEAVLKVINASPNKVVVDPQPFLIKMEKEFVQRENFDALSTRVAALEVHRHNDQMNIMAEIANVPMRVIEMLRKTKDLI
jgi:hypothetical protein